VIVFVLAERSGSTTRSATLLRFGAAWRVLVWQGEYWRLATSMFLHIGVIHLLWNGYYGFRLSTQVERAIGSGRFVALYLHAQERAHWKAFRSQVNPGGEQPCPGAANEARRRAATAVLRTQARTLTLAPAPGGATGAAARASGFDARGFGAAPLGSGGKCGEDPIFMVSRTGI
jgi:Rhomboid family